jgi:hypothetical protein
MKKTVKKLALSKQTLRNLVDRELSIPLGGSSWGLLSCDPNLCYDEFTSNRNC